MGFFELPFAGEEVTQTCQFHQCKQIVGSQGGGGPDAHEFPHVFCLAWGGVSGNCKVPNRCAGGQRGTSFANNVLDQVMYQACRK